MTMDKVAYSSIDLASWAIRVNKAVIESAPLQHRSMRISSAHLRDMNAVSQNTPL